ncbi:MAG: DUF6285 domain-containing protein [Deltaproteobacteria bacterium]|nr:DUF6285 domain-containing protein [Deltaproteobacteria bacterium]
MQDRPTRHELLDAVLRFIEEELVPDLEGRLKFLARVSANVLRIVDREIENESAHLAREWAGLDGLLGPEAMPADPAAAREAVTRRSGALCDRIRTGEADAGPFREAVMGHLRETIREKVSVSDPGILERDEGGMQSPSPPSRPGRAGNRDE